MARWIRYGVDLAALGLVYILWLYPRWKRCGRVRLAVNTLLYLYFAGVLYVTLMPVLVSLPRCLDHPYVPMQMTPFVDVIHGRGDYVRQIVLNIVMTVPFGVLLPLCRRCAGKRCGLGRCLLLTAALSLGIELLQPLINASRSADITDLITNSIGGAVGYGIYALLRPVWRRWLPEKEKRDGCRTER